jgi:Phasin protein
MRSALHNRFPTYDVRGSYPNVYFADLAPETSGSQNCGALASWPRATLSAPKSVSEAAIQSAQFLNREVLTITQRNVNRTFSLLKRLAAIRNFGTIVDLEAAYWPDRFMALIGQIEELSALSAEAVLDMLNAMTAGLGSSGECPIPAPPVTLANSTRDRL